MLLRQNYVQLQKIRQVTRTKTVVLETRRDAIQKNETLKAER